MASTTTTTTTRMSVSPGSSSPVDMMVVVMPSAGENADDPAPPEEGSRQLHTATSTASSKNAHTSRKRGITFEPEATIVSGVTPRRPSNGSNLGTPRSLQAGGQSFNRNRSLNRHESTDTHTSSRRNSMQRTVSGTKSDGATTDDEGGGGTRRSRRSSRRASVVVYSATQMSAISAASEKVATRNEEDEEQPRSAFVIMPNSRWYHHFMYMVVAAALITGILEPYQIAFSKYPDLYPYKDAAAVLQLGVWLVFAVDMVAKFFIAYFDITGVLVLEPAKIRMHYLTSLFWVDFVAIFPFDTIALEATGLAHEDTNLARYVALIKLIKLMRMYRIFDLFTLLEYRMILGQFSLMLIRNNLYVFYMSHWAACALYLIARQESFGPESWAGHAAARMEGQTIGAKYIYSLYMAMTTFTGLGDADFYPASPAESLFMIVYLLINLVVAAFILGTMTMLIVKSDKRSKIYRERVTNLDIYSRQYELPENLHDAMKEHVDLHHHSAEVSDEQVLCFYPTTIRRRVLRHLYLSNVKSCYLFRHCKQKFLDALLTATHVELFMPKVQILSEGDLVNELFIIVTGEVGIMQGGYNIPAVTSNLSGGSSSFAVGNGSFKAAASKDMDMSNDGKEAALSSGFSTRTVSQPFGETSFFTEVPIPDVIYSRTVVRVMTIARKAWEALEESFPSQCRRVLDNLRVRACEEMAAEVRSAADRMQIESDMRDTLLALLRRRDCLDSLKPAVVTDIRDSLSPLQMQALERVDEIKIVVAKFTKKVDEARTYELLNAASVNLLERLDAMLEGGMSPDSADYDGRTGLMLASYKGHEEVVRVLLDRGADHSLKDNFGNTAMSEAVKGGHDEVIDLLLHYGATLGVDGIMVAAQMCECVYKGTLDMLLRLLRAGAHPDAADYDSRTALHIAAAEGNLEAVKMMLEVGEATVDFPDRWNNTALDEAKRVGASDVVEYLEEMMPKSQVAQSGSKWKAQQLQAFLQCCDVGDSDKMQQLLDAGVPANVQAGLMLAATRGHTAVVQQLVKFVPRSALQQAVGLNALWAAVMGGTDLAVQEITLALNVRLPDVNAAEVRSALFAAVRDDDSDLVRRLLSAGAGANVVEDGASSTTPLHLAVQAGSLETARVLLEQGQANLHAKDAAGVTPLDIANCLPGSSSGLLAEYLCWASEPGTDLSTADQWVANKRKPSGATKGIKPSIKSTAGGQDDDVMGDDYLIAHMAMANLSCSSIPDAAIGSDGQQLLFRMISNSGLSAQRATNTYPLLRVNSSRRHRDSSITGGAPGGATSINRTSFDSSGEFLPLSAAPNGADASPAPGSGGSPRHYSGGMDRGSRGSRGGVVGDGTLLNNSRLSAQQRRLDKLEEDVEEVIATASPRGLVEPLLPLRPTSGGPTRQSSGSRIGRFGSGRVVPVTELQAVGGQSQRRRLSAVPEVGAVDELIREAR